ncbi:putative transcription factor spt8 protein [Zalerion maritima]|uniref:Mitochondrial division protein 1 n=1 Tax=Zalerion maritima TaxID=339359 RepID=A0AAD5RWF1_9PEZI|nr:putative transcription factor spt8 protein [Zalerion maritima]
MDDDDRDSNTSSYNDQDQDDNMDNADEMDVDNDPDNEEDDNDNDNDNDDDNDDQDQDDDDDDGDNDDDDTQDPNGGATQQDQNNSNSGEGANGTRGDGKPRSGSPQNSGQTPSGNAAPWKLEPRPDVVNARLYDIVPTMAAPQATSINTIAITPDMRYWMTGGTDGYVRKYDGVGTINGKQLLTVAQRHPFVDSVTKAGVLMSYWENFEPPNAVKGEENVLSPVYSLAVHSQALWCLAGLESGGINMQTVRHLEGTRMTCLQKHTNAVSVLSLAADEQSVLSGSWDKTILDWDLNTGDSKRSFDGSGGQISAIEPRPSKGAPIPLDSYDEPVMKNEFSNYAEPLPAGSFTNGLTNGIHDAPPASGPARTDTMGTAGQDAQASPAHESLFGGGSDGGSLFGDTDAMGATFGGDDDEFSRAMEMTLQNDPLPAEDSNNNNNNNLGGNDMGNDSMGDRDLNMSGDMNMDLAFDPESGPAPAVQALDGNLNLHNTNMNWTTGDSADPVLALADPTMLNGDASTSQPGTSTGLTSTLPTISGPDTSIPIDSQPLPDMALSGNFDSLPDLPSSGMPLLGDAGTSQAHLDPTQSSDSTFMTASIDGTLRIWDRRVQLPVARIGNRPGVPPWCMGACWSPDGNTIFAGRRNGTVEEFSIHKARYGWEPERSLKFPAGAGAVSAVRPMPNGRHLVCASHDILRLYDLRDQTAFKHSTVPFLIIPGPPKAGVISQLWIDPTSRFMVSAAGTRGWDGTSTEVIIGYEIGVDER